MEMISDDNVLSDFIKDLGAYLFIYFYFNKSLFGGICKDALACWVYPDKN